MAWLKKICCLFENLMLGKLLNFFTDLPRVAYKMVAYKKNTCTPAMKISFTDKK